MDYVNTDDGLIKFNDICSVTCDDQKCEIVFGKNEYCNLTSFCSKDINQESYEKLTNISNKYAYLRKIDTNELKKYKNESKKYKNELKKYRDAHIKQKLRLPNKAQIEYVSCSGGYCDIKYYPGYGKHDKYKRVKESKL